MADAGARMLAAVLFTDIVGSTERATQLGDSGWRDILSRHHAIVRGELVRFGGREVDTAGDGFFAVFDVPASAVRCARSAIDALAPLGLQIRAGVHMGEVSLIGDKVGGIAAPPQGGGEEAGRIPLPARLQGREREGDLFVG